MLIGIVSIYQRDFTNVKKMFNPVKIENAAFLFKIHLLVILSKWSRHQRKVGHNRKIISFFPPIVGF